MKKIFNYFYSAKELELISDSSCSIYSFSHDREILHSLSDEEYAMQEQYNNSYLTKYFQYFTKTKLILECFSFRGI